MRHQKQISTCARGPTGKARAALSSCDLPGPWWWLASGTLQDKKETGTWASPANARLHQQGAALFRGRWSHRPALASDTNHHCRHFCNLTGLQTHQRLLCSQLWFITVKGWGQCQLREELMGKVPGRVQTQTFHCPLPRSPGTGVWQRMECCPQGHSPLLGVQFLLELHLVSGMD